MPTTTTTTEAGQIVHENITARRARIAAEAAARRADVTTPLPAGVVVEDLPADLPDVRQPEKPARKITIATTVEHRGRAFTIQAEGMTLDQFCDLLDKGGYTAAQQTQEWQRLPDGTPICPKHHAAMRKRERQGDTWYSHNVAGDGEPPVYCKGYHGKDSPGYEL